MLNPLFGTPLTSCDLLQRITTEENDSAKTTYHIYDSCIDSIFQKVRLIGNLEYELSLSIDMIFRNNFTENYYRVMYLYDKNIKFKRKYSKMGILILDTELEKIKFNPAGPVMFYRLDIHAYVINGVTILGCDFLYK